jgi:hypothetical protein
VVECISLSDLQWPSLKVTWRKGMPFAYAVARDAQSPTITESWLSRYETSRHSMVDSYFDRIYALPAVKVSIALTHQASKSCAD